MTDLNAFENLSQRNWRFAIAQEPLGGALSEAKTQRELARCDVAFYDAIVPGNVELDLGRAGLVEGDPFFGMNIVALRRYERCHVWYTCQFAADAGKPDSLPFLVLEGVDCFADIFINGKLLGSVDNMLIAHEFDLTGLLNGENELLVHIRPAFLESRKFELAPGNAAGDGNWESIRVRKAPHMYGWDIMPRALSAGLWRPVRIEWRSTERIDQYWLSTRWVSEGRAGEAFWYRLQGVDPLSAHYEVEIKGSCGESTFRKRSSVVGVAGRCVFDVENPRLWWPRGRGDANLYNVSVRLLRNGDEVDRHEFRHGIRTIELNRTEIIDAEGKGEFVFLVNGERLFILGTNWAPLDAYHSRDEKRLDAAISLLDESGCNMVRCWGGNVYESDRFFDLCDERGVLVWQDFAMACKLYPQDDDFARKIEIEARSVVRRIRNHASLAIWCGDNECDSVPAWNFWLQTVDPNMNRLTREVIPRVLREEDPSRAYLPSSPYIGPSAFGKGEDDLPEQHLWGPRRSFKTAYYKDSRGRFASEIGYHGSPSVESIKRFISAGKLWPPGNDEWLLHATSAIPGVHNNDYRIELMRLQIGDLFGCAPETLEEFVQLSQCVQAEAMKFFIELFRSRKWSKTGIIWWNLIDGWPQFSDAVVDYYYDKKLAFNWIANAQRPLHLVVREQEPGSEVHELVACNDTRDNLPVRFSLSSVSLGSALLAGEAVSSADSVTVLGEVKRGACEQDMYTIEWCSQRGKGRSHYLAGDPPFDAASYLRWLTVAVTGARGATA
ncbi:MAG: glycoside hydrolase family 2 TIM barrel-domain containing protein [Capsulimonadaceae bacterium]|nr:glycoside hydrolase family 2 TIM barrel-domain containing protein [Capsulimonadaceae bacterium]